ncbi:MAG TPA: Mth938-like domain-containing protein [Steroidobacter sp.]|jgi:uncharacterized protein|nr:Mth938-like domain-containing protein [Steroidobacteraceae bacterium]HLS81428.1 Mth938-like domain-containing protein [Steroidobacter sp.]
MKLTDHKTEGAFVVRSWSPGRLRVGEETLVRSCLMRADRLVRDWRPQSVAELSAADLEPVLALEPEIVVLGTGSQQRFPPAELLAVMLQRGVGCEVMDTGAASRTYNVLVSEDRRVVAALMVGAESG